MRASCYGVRVCGVCVEKMTEWEFGLGGTPYLPKYEFVTFTPPSSVVSVGTDPVVAARHLDCAVRHLGLSGSLSATSVAILSLNRVLFARVLSREAVAADAYIDEVVDDMLRAGASLREHLGGSAVYEHCEIVSWCHCPSDVTVARAGMTIVMAVDTFAIRRAVTVSWLGNGSAVAVGATSALGFESTTDGPRLLEPMVFSDEKIFALDEMPIGALCLAMTPRAPDTAEVVDGRYVSVQLRAPRSCVCVCVQARVCETNY